MSKYSYTMPDGTTSSTRPKPYDTFQDRDGTIWLWDDMDETWEEVPSDAFPLLTISKKPQKPLNKCTCGSASVGSPKHSHWCDIDKPMEEDEDVGDWFGI